MLYYLPLEPYIERYTYFMSAKDGWAESNFKKFNVPFVRIDGKSLSTSIHNGVVLDACGRNYYAMSQIMQIIELINSDKITDDDIIYVEDYWHPGISSLFYIRHMRGMHFKVATFIHAQSVDDTDFAWNMREWMRPIEQGLGNQYDYIFTCSPILKQLCIVGGIAREDNIFDVGLPYNSETLLEQLKNMGFKPQPKEKSVIFASRFDDEKDPMFFLDLVEACPDVQFKLVNPRQSRPITSNQEVLDRLNVILARDNSNLKLINTFDKISYYEALSSATIIFNCANQDWVSWTLLEGITFECNPLFPIWKDFVYELNGNQKYLYQKRNLTECKAKLYDLLGKPFDAEELRYIIDKHNDSWHRYLKIMGVINV